MRREQLHDDPFALGNLLACVSIVACIALAVFA